MDKKRILIGIGLILVIIVMAVLSYVDGNKEEDIFHGKNEARFIPEVILEHKRDIRSNGYMRDSVGTRQDAINEVINEYGKGDSNSQYNTGVYVEYEGEYYYLVRRDYLKGKKDYYTNKTWDEPATEYYVFFKRDYIDVDEQEINMRRFENKKDLKELMDIYVGISNLHNGSFNPERSTIKENASNYVYTVYYTETTYGDWGLNDEKIECSRDYVIDKTTGEWIRKDERELGLRFDW